MRVIFLALAIGLGLCGCRPRKVVAPPPPPTTAASATTLVAGTVIRSGGSWSDVGSGTDHILSVTTRGKQVQWRHYVSRPGGGSKGNTSGSIDAGTPPGPWFIYVESPDRLWFFDGSSSLSYRIWQAGSSDAGDAIHGGTLKESTEPVPQELVPLLPENLQKLFPAEASKPRPSI